MPVNGPQADGNVRQRLPVSPDLQASVREFDWWAIWSGRTRVETHTARDSFPAVDHFSGSSTLVASQSCNTTWAAAPEGLFGGLLRKVLPTFTVFRWRMCLTSVDWPGSPQQAPWGFGAIPAEPEQNFPETWKIFLPNWFLLWLCWFVC